MINTKLEEDTTRTPNTFKEEICTEFGSKT
jgi:hypothetical protein